MIPDVEDGDYGWHDHMVRLNCLELAIREAERQTGRMFTESMTLEIAQKMYDWVICK